MLFPKKVITSATTLSSSSSVWLLVFFTCVTLNTALSTSDQQQSQQLSGDTSSYGERLAESSYVFNSIANGGSSSFGSSSSQKEASSDGSGSYYSPGVSALLNSDGFLNTMSKFSPGGAEGAKYTPSGPVEAAVHTKKTIEVIPVRFEEPKEGEPQVIEISPYEVPLSIVFKTATNKINVNQEHRSETPEEVKETTSEEEPHRVVHNVYRPVIQEVTEVIQPIRKMLQRVEPVIEEMKTIISKAGPPEGGNSNGYSRPSSSGGFSAQKATLDDNRFARYGGNDLGRGLSILPLSYSSASEVIKKLSSPPSSLSSVTSMSSENEMSRRFGITNRPTRVDEGNSYSQKQSTTTNDNNNNNNNEEAANTKTDYNDIIKEYITKFLEPSRAPGAKSGASKSNKHSLKINPAEH
ncbi:hypothetical protein TYRP_002594 [Tyrophagus putrescentiae]|nr:hypothetical protein TYRP_002594 [Tyrophagus putrescentiae]